MSNEENGNETKNSYGIQEMIDDFKEAEPINEYIVEMYKLRHEVIHLRDENAKLKAENAELKEGYIKEIYGEMLSLYDVEIESIEAIADPADPTGMNIKVFVTAYCTYLNYGEDRRRSTDKLYVIMASTNKGKDWDVCRDRNRCVIVEETWREARKTMERMYRMQREEADMFGLAHIPRKYFKIVEFSPTEVEINVKKDKTQKQ